MLNVATESGKSRAKRSANMGDPSEDNAEADALPTDPVTVAAREALRAPAGTREGTILKPGEGWGRNMTLRPTGDWHGTRDGKGCSGTPLTEPDASRGLVRGQCPDCGAKFEKEEPNVMSIDRDARDARKLAEQGQKIVVDPKHGLQRSRELERQAISREVLQKMIKKLDVPEIRTEEHRAAFDAELRAAYRSANLA